MNSLEFERRPNVRPGRLLPPTYLALISPRYVFISSMYPRRTRGKYYIEIDGRRFNIDTNSRDPYKQLSKYLIASGFIDRLVKKHEDKQLNLYP
jgi:hypothetical protein